MAGIGPDSSQLLRLPRPTRGYERTVCASCGFYGTDRYAHADFFRAPRDEERDDAEEANGAQDETPPDSFQGQIPGTNPTNPAVPMEGDFLKVNVDYFRAMGMRVVRGRGFTSDDVLAVGVRQLLAGRRNRR